MSYLIDNRALQRNAERLIPPEEGGIIEIDSIGEFYEHFQSRDRWRLFATPDKNYAIYRADFILRSGLSVSSALEDLPAVVYGGEDVDEDQPEDGPTLLTAVQATELWLTKARIIGRSLLIPGVMVSYTNLGFPEGRGYGGFKTWLIEDEATKPEDAFWIPIRRAGITGDGIPVFDETGARVTMPDLGDMCTRQMQALGERLAEVDISQKVVM